MDEPSNKGIGAQGAPDLTQGAAIAQKPNSDLTIPKFRFDEVSKNYQDSLAKINSLSKELESAMAFKTEKEKLEKEFADFKATYEKEKVNAAKHLQIKEAIGDKTVDFELLKTLLDMDKIVIDEKGELTGLEEQVSKLQESKPYLWKKLSPIAAKSAAKPGVAEKSFAQQLAEAKAANLGIAGKKNSYFN